MWSLVNKDIHSHCVKIWSPNEIEEGRAWELSRPNNEVYQEIWLQQCLTPPATRFMSRLSIRLFFSKYVLTVSGVYYYNFFFPRRKKDLNRLDYVIRKLMYTKKNFCYSHITWEKNSSYWFLNDWQTNLWQHKKFN